MNKRIICIVLAMLLLIPFVLTSCSKELTEDEIIDKIINSGSTALTLSIWVPTEANVDDKFNERLDAVEEAINAILRDKNYSTMVELKAINVSEYEKALNEKFDSMEQAVKNEFGGQLPSVYSQGYVNTANKIPVGNSYMYELAYPGVINSQLDIFYIGSYDSYLSHVNSGDAHKLNSYIDVGSKYGDINKMIAPKILDMLSVGGGKYALPNNHLYTKDATYQYVLIDTELFDAYKDQKGFDDDFKVEDILDCEDFINFVGENYSDYVPFVGTTNDAPGIYGFDSSSLIGGSVANSAPSSVFEIEAYNSYVSMLKRLNSSYIKSELADGEKAAVSFFYGTNEELEALDGDYTVIKSETPVADKESIYESMFAISKYSIDYDRAMKMLYILQSNEEIVTLLQHGIEGVDYEIVTDRKTGVQSVVRNEKSAYDMTGVILGNSYCTYKLGEAPNYEWEDVKEINYDLVVDPYMNFLDNYNEYATDDEKAELAALQAELSQYYASVLGQIENMTAEEYAEFIELYLVDYSEVLADIEELEAKEELSEKELTELVGLLVIKAACDANALITEINASSFKNLVALYQSLYYNYN